MKYLRSSFLLAFALLMLVFGISADDDGVVIYTVNEEDGIYGLYSSESINEPIYRDTSLNSVMERVCAIGGASVTFVDVTTDDSIILSGGEVSISGTLSFFSGADLINNGAAISINGASLEFDIGGIKIDRGAVYMQSGSIRSGNSAIKMNYSASAYFELCGGEIFTESYGGAILLESGTAKIRGGRVENSLGAAIESSSELLLLDSPSIFGAEYDIYTTEPITLFEGEKSYNGSVSIKFGAKFERGSSSEVLRSQNESALSGITLFNKDSLEMELTYFKERGAAFVYLPFAVRFYDRGGVVSELFVLSGERVSKPTAPTRIGYDFCGWSLVDGSTELYEFAAGVFGDINLFSVYKLTPPSFTLSSIVFSYDGAMRFLSLEELSHPFMNEGLTGCEWYKDGKSLSKFGDKIGVRAVSDSGEYKCKITFSVGSDSVTVFTPSVLVTVKKGIVELPQIPETYYTGDFIYPEIFDTAAYTVSRIGGVEVGTYPITLTLRDAENYKFQEVDGSVATVDFVINKATNYWREDLSVTDVYEGERPEAHAISAFGEVKYLYCKRKDGYFTEAVPTAAGAYYVKAFADGNDNFTDIESDAVEFSVLKEEILGIAVITPPAKTEYTAFMSFDPSGMSVGVSYNSGRQEIIDDTKLSFSYQSADSFRFSDSGILISYKGASVLFKVSVKKAEYDLSGVKFEDTVAVYGADFKSAVLLGKLPVGKDGIPLSASISGGGVNVGEYISVLTFSTESINYAVPQSLSAKITVTPCECDVIWEERVFTYDGSPKLPKAYFIDVLGRKRTLGVSGARSYAGTYTAEAVYNDTNYLLRGETSDYTIVKASYDLSGIVWSAKEYVYDGEERRVVIVSGLPSGVSVVGYANNKATESGEYKASVTFLYDSANYLAPVYDGYEWSIERAEYSLSDFSFSDLQTVYDGNIHYPTFSGNLPIGVDGSSPTYSFSRGVSNVADGRVRVEISFKTESKNYNAPQSIFAYVEILPIKISVDWTSLIFTYDGELHIPTAFAEESEIIVKGGAVGAGEHIASAVALNENYSVINSSTVYKIERAVNYWIEELTVLDGYCGKNPSSSAVAYKGTVKYAYYKDYECKITAENFITPGIYYAVAYTDGDENHLGLRSEAVKFTVREVLPVELCVELKKGELFAFEKIAGEDFIAFLKNNDGSTTAIESAGVSVNYLSGDSLRTCDKFVEFSYGTFNVELPISVSKATYDLSAVIWESLLHVYDGTEKCAVLSGLPNGIDILEYVGNSAVNAGQYSVYARISYDGENYYEPEIPPCTMVISKCVISIPQVESTTYDGFSKNPTVADSPLYTVSFPGGAVRAGSYSVNFTVCDPQNYCFPNGNETAEAPFYINRRAIRVKILDDDVFYLENKIDFGFEIVGGALATGDVLTPDYYVEGNGIYADFNDPDYDVSVIPGKIIRQNKLSPVATVIVAIIFATLLVGCAVLVFLIKRKKRLYFYFCGARGGKGRFFNKGKDLLRLESAKISPPTARPLTTVDAERALDVGANAVMAIDAEYADSAITDDLAKKLLRRDGEVVTGGWRRRTINVDVISRSFLPGERVDVNSLKERGLVPKDTAYIKVLARGIIDKPLNVYANEFSLAAIKMIALSGGKAVKISKRGKRKKRDKEKNSEIT